MFILNGTTIPIKPHDIDNFIKSIVAPRFKGEYEFILLIDDDLFTTPHMEYVNYNYINEVVDWHTPEWFEGQDIHKVTVFTESDLATIVDKHSVRTDEFSI